MDVIASGLHLGVGASHSPAGLGGCLIGLIRDRAEGEGVLEAALRAGAVGGWVLKVDEGVRVEYRG